MKFKTDVPARMLEVTFDDGDTVQFRGDSVPTAAAEWLLMYGMKQWLSDSAASALKLSQDSELTVEELRKKMVLTAWDRILTGSLQRAKGDGIAQVSYLSLAIVALYGKTKAEADAILAAMDKAARKNLEASKKIAAWIATEKARRAAEKAAKLQETGSEDEDKLPEL